MCTRNVFVLEVSVYRECVYIGEMVCTRNVFVLEVSVYRECVYIEEMVGTRNVFVLEVSVYRLFFGEYSTGNVSGTDVHVRP